MAPTIPKRKDPLRGEYIIALTGAAGVMTDQFFGVTWRQACQWSRKSEESRARRWAAWWLQGMGLSLREIGRSMGRDHKAVVQMLDRAKVEIELGRMNTGRITEIANAEIGDWRRTDHPPTQDAVSQALSTPPSAEEG